MSCFGRAHENPLAADDEPSAGLSRRVRQDHGAGTRSLTIRALALTRTETGDTLPPAFTTRQKSERLWAAYMDRPLFIENFSAPEALDAGGGNNRRSLDDWNTVYQGGSRLVKYLRHVGYGGIMLSVFSDGSTIYPSRTVASDTAL